MGGNGAMTIEDLAIELRALATEVRGRFDIIEQDLRRVAGQVGDAEERSRRASVRVEQVEGLLQGAEARFEAGPHGPREPHKPMPPQPMRAFPGGNSPVPGERP